MPDYTAMGFLEERRAVKFKQNLEETIARNRALWGRESQGRVLAKIDLDSCRSFETWDRAIAPDVCPDAAKMLNVFFDDFAKRADLLDDGTPTARPNIGDAAFGAYAGAEITFVQGGGVSKPMLDDLGEMDRLSYDPHSRWLAHLEESTRFFSEACEGACPTSIIETVDGLNFAENVMGPKAFFEIYDHPQELLRLFDFALEFNVRMIEMQRKYIKKWNGGYFDLHEEWLPGDCIWLSIDAWGLCSPESFRSLGRHHLQRIMDHFGGGWIHMHNSHLHLLDEIVGLDGLVGIGILDDPRQELCFERLSRIQEVTHDIPLQIWCTKDQLLRGIAARTLPRNVMYWVTSGVATVEEGNRIMEMVRDYDAALR